MHFSTPLFLSALAGSAVASNIPRGAWYGQSSWATGSTSSSSSSSSSSSPSSSATSTTSTKPSGTGIYPSKTTEVLTSFTTTTVCPVTYTSQHGSSVEIVTTFTTSTLTITSCKSGCHHNPTSIPSSPVLPASNTTVPVKPTKPAHSGGGVTSTTVYPTTIITTSTKFVPCSTPVATSAGTTYYSTWLTPTLIPTSYVSTCTDTYTAPAPTTTLVIPPPIVPVLPVSPVSPVGPVDTCPPAKTVTVTVGSGAIPTPPPADCKSCYEVHTLTLTNGQTSVITITHTKPPHGGKPTDTPSKPTTTPVTPPNGTGKPTPPKPTGSGGAPAGTGQWHMPSPSAYVW